MSDQKFPSLNDLLKNLASGIERLEAGELEIDELSTVVNNAREVYERLVVLRFKAYDELVHETAEVVLPTQEPISIPTSEEDLVEIVETALPETPAIIDEPAVAAPQPVEQTRVAEKPPVAPVTNAPAAEPKANKLADPVTISEKLSKSPISDLKKAVGLNQKFLFINTLFSGDAHAYEHAMTELNSFSSHEEAELRCQELAGLHKWDQEEPAVIQFVELVERRYL